MHLSIEIDREDDGRWIAEALELPGVIAYGATREEAISNTERLAIEVIARASSPYGWCREPHTRERSPRRRNSSGHACLAGSQSTPVRWQRGTKAIQSKR